MRTMVGEVVGLRRSKYIKKQHKKRNQNIGQKNTLQAITFAYQAEHNSLRKQSKTKVKTTKDRLTALQVAIAIKKIIDYYGL